MTIDKAIEKLKARYDTAKDDPNNMVDPVEWSLYYTWKEAEMERHRKLKRGIGKRY